MKDYFYNIASAPACDLISATESSVQSSNLVRFGTNNNYPVNIYALIEQVPVLKALISGSAMVASSAPFTKSDLVHIEDSFFNELYDDVFSLGAAYVLVRLSNDHKQKYLSIVPARFVRSNSDYSKFYYSEFSDFRHRKEVDSFLTSPGSDVSILPILLPHSGRVYPLPIWSSAQREVSILRSIAEYHSSAMNNSFSPSAIITFCNGEPSEEEKDEIERSINRKFAGSTNGSRILLNFANSTDTAPKIDSFSTEDISARYTDLREHCNRSLFTSFRATPSIFGIPEGSSTALSEVEYAQQSKLFYLFTLKPIMKIVASALFKVGINIDVTNPFLTLE